MNETVNKLVVNTSTILKEQINFYNLQTIGKSWNDTLLERGGWPLFIIFYGFLYLAFWLIIYYSFKFLGYEDQEDDEDTEENEKEKV